MDNGTFSVNGLTIGEHPYPLLSAPSGILGTGFVREVDQFRARGDGVIPGDDLLGGRSVFFEVGVLGDSPADAEQLTAELVAAFAPSPTDTTLTGRLSGSPAEYAFVGRCRGADVLLDWMKVAPSEQATTVAFCRFVATDPIRYAAVESSLLLDLTGSGVGLEYPVGYPVVYGGGAGSGSGSAVNAGSARVHWRATLTGPLTNPRLALAGTGKFVRLLASIADGETVLLDSRSGSILLGGSSPRPGWFAPGSRWFRLERGSNGLTFTADAGSGDIEIVWRSGWA